MPCLKKGLNQPGPILSTLSIYFVHNFLLNNYSLQGLIYIRPIFYFCDPILRLPFATHILRPHFATHIRDSHSRLTFHDSNRDSIFATHIRDYPSDSNSRIAFATTLATPICDSRSCPQPRLAIFVATSIM